MAYNAGLYNKAQWKLRRQLKMPSQIVTRYSYTLAFVSLRVENNIMDIPILINKTFRSHLWLYLSMHSCIHGYNEQKLITYHRQKTQRKSQTANFSPCLARLSQFACECGTFGLPRTQNINAAMVQICGQSKCKL